MVLLRSPPVFTTIGARALTPARVEVADRGRGRGRGHALTPTGRLAGSGHRPVRALTPARVEGGDHGGRRAVTPTRLDNFMAGKLSGEDKAAPHR